MSIGFSQDKMESVYQVNQQIEQDKKRIEKFIEWFDKKQYSDKCLMQLNMTEEEDIEIQGKIAGRIECYKKIMEIFEIE